MVPVSPDILYNRLKRERKQQKLLEKQKAEKQKADRKSATK